MPVGEGGRKVSTVYACVMLTARAISQCRPYHMIDSPNGAQTPSTTSPASRIYRRPNNYETWAQIILNTVCELLFNGESVWLGVRDDRGAITSAHRMPKSSWMPHVDPESGEIFYGFGGGHDVNPQPDYLVPARDVAHFRMHTPRHPLIGESPVTAAALSVGLNVALQGSQLTFFSRMNRPSGVLSSEQLLTVDQMRQLRAAFDEQSKLWAQGGVPILGGGLTFQPMSISQNDSQLIDQQRLSVTDIARVFGVPMALLSESAGPQGGTEALISHWLSVGLGSVIESLERTLDVFFQFSPMEHTELDANPLLRVDFAKRIEGLSKSVQSGIVAINEARAKEGYGPVANGDVPVLQQQMVPLDLLTELHNSKINATNNPPAPPAPAPAPEPPKDPAKKDHDPEVCKALILSRSLDLLDLMEEVAE